MTSTQKLFREATVTPARRELLFRIMDGNHLLATGLYTFTQFYRCDDMLRWLIRNRITGKNFSAWVKKEFGGSFFGAAKFILTKVKREAELQPVLAGRDFIATPIGRGH